MGSECESSWRWLEKVSRFFSGRGGNSHLSLLKTDSGRGGGHSMGAEIRLVHSLRVWFWDQFNTAWFGCDSADPSNIRGP